jgi:hypothetical protein
MLESNGCAFIPVWFDWSQPSSASSHVAALIAVPTLDPTTPPPPHALLPVICTHQLPAAHATVFLGTQLCYTNTYTPRFASEESDQPKSSTLALYELTARAHGGNLRAMLLFRDAKVRDSTRYDVVF